MLQVILVLFSSIATFSSPMSSPWASSLAIDMKTIALGTV